MQIPVEIVSVAAVTFLAVLGYIADKVLRERSPHRNGADRVSALEIRVVKLESQFANTDKNLERSMTDIKARLEKSDENIDSIKTDIALLVQRLGLSEWDGIERRNR